MKTSFTITYLYKIDPRIRCGVDYVKSRPGVTQLLTLFVCITSILPVSVAELSESAVGIYILFIISTVFFYTAVMSAFYNFHVCEKYFKIAWLEVEVTLMIVLWIMLTTGCFLGITQAAGIAVAAGFGFFPVLILFYEIVRKVRLIRSGAIAQGTREIVSRSDEEEEEDSADHEAIQIENEAHETIQIDDQPANTQGGATAPRTRQIGSQPEDTPC